ncbi:MAG: hypothetical protein GX951_02150, partial [Mollicutes bacterium]|nr:hypothetical protein [Mollicutes bacterium]
MYISIAMIIVTMLFISVISIVYLPKDKVVSSETTSYKYLAILSLVNLLLELLLCTNIVLNINLYSFLNLFLNKIFLITLFLWYMIFAYYLFSLTFLYVKLKEKKIKKVNKVFAIFVIIGCLLITFLPIMLVDDGKYAYSSGPAVNVLISMNLIVVIAAFIIVIKDLKYISKKKIIPLITLMLLMGIVAIFRITNPGILLNSFSTAFTTFLMYFTIENPDMKVLNELYKNKTIMEQTYDDKANFLFEAAQEI